ncbi:MAG: hypothetical protein HKO07_02610 [Pseudomonadales bacterium]|nr:hypothetical protein [Pseudomonadales bacterium]
MTSSEMAIGEMAREGQAGQRTGLLPIGTAVKIVDFDQLSNGLLGIVCEGQYRFRLHRQQVSASGLVVGQIETLSPEGEGECELDAEFADLIAVLLALLDHPYADNLGYDLSRGEDFWQSHAVCLSWSLAGLLPVDEAQKYRWLEIDDVRARLRTIAVCVKQLQGDD